MRYFDIPISWIGYPSDRIEWHRAFPAEETLHWDLMPVQHYSGGRIGAKPPNLQATSFWATDQARLRTLMRGGGRRADAEASKAEQQKIAASGFQTKQAGPPCGS